jgi:methionyl-tRNA formyltransferase
MLAGDVETGITIMQMDAGLDTGAMLLREAVPVTTQTTAESLHDELAQIGARLIVRTLDDVINGSLHPIPQPDQGVTYASKLTREDGKIDWAKPAVEIERQIRALHPWPGCFFSLNGEAVKLLEAKIVDKTGQPGTLLDDHFTVACGKQALQLQKLQRPGRTSTDGSSFLRGLRISVGTRL